MRSLSLARSSSVIVEDAALMPTTALLFKRIQEDEH
jgi:hypothetical protein